MKLMDYNISTKFPQLPLSEKTVINTINPHSYCVAKKDSLFRKALKDSDMLIPDGAGIVVASLILKGVRIPRVTGSDIHLHLLTEAQRLGLRVFYLGASENTLRKVKERVSREYPNVNTGIFSPPYKKEFSKEDSQLMINAVNSFKPDILFVGMTAPKQEKWVAQNIDNLNIEVVASIGAVFDFFAGTVKRPGIFWQKMGLEWLPRLIQEPRRLWTRTMVSTPTFLMEVLKVRFSSN